MATLVKPFDATKVDPEQGMSNLPVGRHKVIIESSEVKPTKDGSNGKVQFNVAIIEGDSQGVTGAYNLNIYHSNPQVVQIAEKQLSALCHVTGVMNLADTQQLHNIPFYIEVAKQTKGEGAEKGYTEIKKVFDANGNEPKAGGNMQNSGGNANAFQQANEPAPNQQQQQNGGWGGGQVADNVPPPNQNQQNGNAQGWGNQQQTQQTNQNQGGGWGNTQGQQQGNGQQQNAGGWGNQNSQGSDQNAPAWGNGNGNGGNQPAWANR